MSLPVQPHPEPPTQRAARLSAEELAARARRLSRRKVDPEELDRWLLAEGFASQVDGLLAPTSATIELAGAFTNT